MSIVNLSAYRFVSLDDLPALRERLLEVHGPRGSMLFATLRNGAE